VTVLLIALAGAAGAGTRFLADGLIGRRWDAGYPWATLIINISGSLLLGVVTGLVLYRGSPEDLRLIVGTGFCGGFTTFSTASFETVRLLQRGPLRRALGYLAATVGLTLGAAAVGLLAVR
jgi:CrcB protein